MSIFAKHLNSVAVPHHKNTASIASVKVPVVDVVTIQMGQHIGAPAKPLVKKGDKVKVGQKIDVKILNFDDDRIQLSYKSVVSDNEQSEENSDTNKLEKKSNKVAEQSEWRSEGQASATIGELFKDLDTEKK